MALRIPRSPRSTLRKTYKCDIIDMITISIAIRSQAALDHVTSTRSASYCNLDPSFNPTDGTAHLPEVLLVGPRETYCSAELI